MSLIKQVSIRTVGDLRRFLDENYLLTNDAEVAFGMGECVRLEWYSDCGGKYLIIDLDGDDDYESD